MELQPDEQALLRFMLGPKRPVYRRERVRSRGDTASAPPAVEKVRPLMSPLEAAIADGNPKLSWPQIQESAKRWDLAGFDASEVREWHGYGIGHFVSEIATCAALRDAGVPARLAAKQVTRNGVRTFDNWWSLVHRGEMSARRVRQLIERAMTSHRAAGTA